jgi:predicted nucleic acid-binding protein
MSIVVSDTSPIRSLHHIGLLRFLERFYKQVFVPPSVAADLYLPPGHFPSIDVRGFSFISVRAPFDAQRVTELRRGT